MDWFEQLALNHGFNPFFVLLSQRGLVGEIIRWQDVPWHSTLLEAKERFPSIRFADLTMEIPHTVGLEEAYVRGASGGHYSSLANKAVAKRIVEML